MAKVINSEIGDLSVSWENYSGESVEKFIKKQLNKSCGYLYRSANKEGDYYYLYGFHNYSDYEEWADGSIDVTPLFKVQLPNLESDTFTANLSTDSNTVKLVNTGSGIKLRLRYTSTRTSVSSGTISDTFNDGTLVVSRAANGSGFVEAARVPISPKIHTSTEYTEVDITSYLADGDNRVRVRVEDNTSGAVSNTILFQSIVNTTLAVRNALPTDQPISALQFKYYLEGQVNKTLHIKLNNQYSYEFPVGSDTYVETPFITGLIDDTNIASGIITAEAWLTVDDTTLESSHATNQFYYISGSSTDAVIVLNNIQKEVINYSNTRFFSFTVYNQTTDVEIKITAGTYTLDYTMRGCIPGRTYNFDNVLEIESQQKTITGSVVVKTSSMTTSYSLTVDNSIDMSPTSGADFVLNPKTRDNSEATPKTIINEATGNAVSSVFSDGFNTIDGGWITCPEDSAKVLRILAGDYVEINYDCLDNLGLGTTIEFDYAVRDVFNDDSEVIGVYTMSGSKMLGYKQTATEGLYCTLNNQNTRDQKIGLETDSRTHVAINIIPNLADSGLNYIRLFIDGIINREMTYAADDTFKNGTVKIKLGSGDSECTTDIYGVRVYKKAMSASNIRQDRMSTLPDLQSKIDYNTFNNILSSNGTISYDKAVNKFNTLVWTGKLPSYETGKVTYAGKLLITNIGDPDYSGTITNLQISGQGSSSRGYWKWNQQFDLTSNSVWTNGNGVRKGNYYQMSATDPKARLLVGKVNWASSQQSHKLGSTKFYTDAWKSIVGGNSITKTAGYENSRVSVHEEPYLFFVRGAENETPVFYSMMTFGQGKYDIPTFQGSESMFPLYTLIEPKDNGRPLALRNVPWITEDISISGNAISYASQVNLEVGMGSVDNLGYFKDAYNLAYLNSTRLKPYSVAADLKDTSYQYWNTSTGNVMRYDHISSTWVDAGTEKLKEYRYHDTTDETTGKTTRVVDQLPQYSKLNIVTQTGISITSGNSTADNTSFINWRRNNFKTKVSLYYNVEDALFHQAFLKLIAASDNRCKNTYEYLDPVTKKICFAQDDLDTIMSSDNVGRFTKPYYVEELDKDSSGAYYFNGTENNFYQLIGEIYQSEIRVMMKRILDFLTESYGSVKEGIEHYYMSIQEYFPAVAYNEQTRLFYEEASVAAVTLKADGKTYKYSNGTPAISQAYGDSIKAERQWWKRRIPYMQSYASADPFYVRSTVESNQQFRSLTTTTGTNPTYTFNLTPAQYLYPKVGSGQSMGYDYTRVPAGTAYTTVSMAADGNTDTFIYGSDYYTSFGEFGGVSLGEAFNLNGTRLKSFSADGRLVSPLQFRPTSMTVNCPVLKYLSLYGVSTLTGNLNLSSCKKLKTVDLRYTGLTGITLPETSSLKTIKIPALENLVMKNCPYVSEFAMDYYYKIKTLDTDNKSIFESVMSNSTNLTKIIAVNTGSDAFRIKPVNLDVLYASGSNLTGKFELMAPPREEGEYWSKESSCVFTVPQKLAMVAKYGDIDNTENVVYIDYYKTGTNGTVGNITGNATLSSETISAAYHITIGSAENLQSITWDISSGPQYATILAGQNTTDIVISPNVPSGSADRTITVRATVKFHGSANEVKTFNVSIQPPRSITGLSITDNFKTIDSVPISAYEMTDSNCIKVNYTIDGKETANVPYQLTCDFRLIESETCFNWAIDTSTYGVIKLWPLDPNGVLNIYGSFYLVMAEIALRAADTKGANFSDSIPVFIDTHRASNSFCVKPDGDPYYYASEVSTRNPTVTVEVPI